MSYGQHTRSGLHVVLLGLGATAELEHKLHVSPQAFHSSHLIIKCKTVLQTHPFQRYETAATMWLSKYKIQNSGQMLKLLSHVASSNSTSHHHLAVDTFQCCILTTVYLNQRDKQALPKKLVPPCKNIFSLIIPSPSIYSSFSQPDRLCGLVVRVSGYRYIGLRFDSRRYQIF